MTFLGGPRSWSRTGVVAVGGLSLSLTLDPSLLKSAGTARLLPAGWDVPCSPVGSSECNRQAGQGRSLSGRGGPLCLGAVGMACPVGCRGFALSDDCFCGWELFKNIVISFFMVLSTKIYSFNRLEISFIYFCLKGREPERAASLHCSFPRCSHSGLAKGSSPEAVQVFRVNHHLLPSRVSLR